MRLQRRDHLGGRQRAGGAEIGRAIDCDPRCRSGVVDHIADANDIAFHGDVGAKHRNRDGFLADLRERRRGSSDDECGGKEEETSSHHQLPQRNSAVVDCSIWSAAVITFAFIS